jgi:hypothetical protein
MSGDGIQIETPESRLKAAGFVQQMGFWVTPDGTSRLHLNDALPGLDSREIKPGGPTMTLPNAGAALPDELVDRICGTAQDDLPEPPPWLIAQAGLIAAETVKQLRPVIRAEVRAELRKAAKP